MPLEDDMWRIGPCLPPLKNIMMTTSRTRTIAMIPDTFTQRGVLGGRSSVGLTPLSLLEFGNLLIEIFSSLFS
jgi:hypothetical protein